jgi:phage-related baseplate assembly protein
VSDPVIADKDPATVLAAALALYKQQTVSAENPNGITLAPSDPRRLHLQTFLLLLAQQRQLIDFSGKQSLLRFVSDDWIDILAELWGLERLGPLPSQCTQRFSFATVAARTVADGVRVSDGTNVWAVDGDTSATDDHIDATVKCIVVGSATNGIAEGQIDTLVDPTLVPGCTGVSNVTETVSGRDTELLEDFRQRLRDEPESRSTCGPRTAYEAAALDASASVADAVALGPHDAADMAGSPPNPGEVFILLLEGERDDSGVLLSVVPDPSGGLLATVGTALSAEDERPLTDLVITKAPVWEDFDAYVTYYIAGSRSDSAAEIQVAVEAAFEAWKLWQQSAIGRDLNPSELTTRLVNAGAKRAAILQPAFTSLKRDQSAKLIYSSLTYGGVEDD